MIHQSTNGCVFARFILAKVDAVDHGTEDDRSNFGKFVVHRHAGGRWPHLKAGAHRFVVQEGPHGPGQRLCGEQIWAIRKNLDVERGVVASVDVRAKQREFLLQSGHIMRVA